MPFALPYPAAYNLGMVATIISGLVVYIVGQIIYLFVIIPINEQRKTIAQISEALTLYGNRLYRQDAQQFEDQLPVHDAFRLLASRLEAASVSMRWYGLWSKCKFVLPMHVIIEVRGKLIGISGGCLKTQKEGYGRGYQMEDAKKIKELLEIRV